MSIEQVPASDVTDVQRIIKKHNINILGNGKKTLVFGHGFGCDQEIWQQVYPQFLSDYKVVLYDYMGCGKSEIELYDAAYYSKLDSYASDLKLICETLSLTDCYFIGHSVSGAIAMLASIESPSLFKKIIAIAPSPCYLDHPPDYIGGFEENDISEMFEMMERNYFNWTEYLVPLVSGSGIDSNENKALKDSFLRTDPVISKNFAMVTFYCDIRDQLKNVKNPVSVLYCMEDIIVPLEVINFLKENLLDCNLVKLDASGHYPQLTNPKAVIRAIQEQINRDT